MDSAAIICFDFKTVVSWYKSNLQKKEIRTTVLNVKPSLAKLRRVEVFKAASPSKYQKRSLSMDLRKSDCLTMLCESCALSPLVRVKRFCCSFKPDYICL